MRRILPYVPLLAPVVGFAVIVSVTRPVAIVARDGVPPAVARAVYDECDLTAFALRGLNADLGRRPGRLDEPNDPDWTLPPVTLPRRLKEPQPPFAERYYLEYPTPALLLFWAGYAVQPAYPDEVPSVLADAHQFSVAFHKPETLTEVILWERMRVAIMVYVGIMAVGLFGLMMTTGFGYEPGGRWGGPVWLAALPGAAYFALNRYDILPALATAVAFACLGRGRRGWAGAALGVGVALKLYPVLFLPVMLRYLGPRDGLRFVAGFAGVLVVAFGGSAVWLGTDATLGPILVQLSRPFEEQGWTFYGRVLPTALAEMRTARLGLLAAAVLATVVTRPRSLDSVLRRCGLGLVVFVVLAVFWSPQWLIWFLPILIPLGRTRAWPIAVAVVLDLSTYYAFPVLFWDLWGIPDHLFDTAVGLLIYFRAVLWSTVAAGFVWDEVRAGRATNPRRIRALFLTHQGGLLDRFLVTAAKAGTPRGLEWVGVEARGEPLFVRDADGGVVALMPVEVQFAPVPGSDMADVPQAREPRPITVVFRHDGEWRADGRAVFNLTPRQVVDRGGGRYTPLE